MQAKHLVQFFRKRPCGRMSLTVELAMQPLDRITQVRDLTIFQLQARASIDHLHTIITSMNISSPWPFWPEIFCGFSQWNDGKKTWMFQTDKRVLCVWKWDITITYQPSYLSWGSGSYDTKNHGGWLARCDFFGANKSRLWSTVGTHLPPRETTLQNPHERHPRDNCIDSSNGSLFQGQG